MFLFVGSQQLWVSLRKIFVAQSYFQSSVCVQTHPLFWFVPVLRGHANKTADEYDTVRSEDFITKGLKDFTKFIDGGFHKDLRVANYFNTFVFLACQRSVHTKVPLVKPRP